MKSKDLILHLSQERLKLLAQSRVTDILNELNSKKNGCTFSQLQFSLHINPSILSPALKRLANVGYALKKGDKYTITQEGIAAYEACIALVASVPHGNLVSTNQKAKNFPDSRKTRRRID